MGVICLLSVRKIETDLPSFDGKRRDNFSARREDGLAEREHIVFEGDAICSR